jgi:hypothetical protein
VWILLGIVKTMLADGVVDALIGGKMLGAPLQKVCGRLPDVCEFEAFLVHTVKAVDSACLGAIGTDLQDALLIVTLSGIDLFPVWLFSHFPSLSRLVSCNADSISTRQHRCNNYCKIFHSLNI